MLRCSMVVSLVIVGSSGPLSVQAGQEPADSAWQLKSAQQVLDKALADTPGGIAFRTQRNDLSRVGHNSATWKGCAGRFIAK